jgi:hypothetical protein
MALLQVLLFAILAVEIKRKAPTAHTCLEIVKVRAHPQDCTHKTAPTKRTHRRTARTPACTPAPGLCELHTLV